MKTEDLLLQIAENVADLARGQARQHEELVTIKTLQARHNTELETHTRRSLALEKHVDLVEQEMAPLKAHVAMWAGAGKVLTTVGAIGGVVAAALKILGKG